MVLPVIVARGAVSALGRSSASKGAAAGSHSELRDNLRRSQRSHEFNRKREMPKHRSRFDQVRQGVSLALEHRKAIAQGDFSVFLPAFAMAIAKDAIFDLIPFIGIPFGIFISVYLFVFLWGKGSWKVRLVVFLLTIGDAVPIVNLLPMQTLCVFYAYHVAKKKARKSQEQLAALGEA